MKGPFISVFRNTGSKQSSLKVCTQKIAPTTGESERANANPFGLEPIVNNNPLVSDLSAVGSIEENLV